MNIIDKLKSFREIVKADLNVMEEASKKVWEERKNKYPLGALNYPMVLYIMSLIDFLGGLHRGKFNQGESKNRTVKYIQNYFPQEYKIFTEPQVKSIFYNSYRCGLGHEFNPKNDFGIISEPGLENYHLNESGDGKWRLHIIVLKNDFLKSLDNFIKEVENNSQQIGIKYERALNGLNRRKNRGRCLKCIILLIGQREFIKQIGQRPLSLP